MRRKPHSKPSADNRSRDASRDRRSDRRRGPRHSSFNRSPQSRASKMFLALCIGLVLYFGYHTFKGRHSLQAHTQLKLDIKQLEATYKKLVRERAKLERSVALMRPEMLDPDMLDEQARSLLNYAHPNDIVIMRQEKP